MCYDEKNMRAVPADNTSLYAGGSRHTIGPTRFVSALQIQQSFIGDFP